MFKKAFRLIILFSFAVITAGAQNLSKSPYSFYGIGDMQFGGNATQSAMGQSTQGLRRISEINNSNPASYGSLKLTVIEAGFNLSGGTISNYKAENFVYTSSFAYVGFGLPISQKLRWGASFGLQPFSSIGYNVSSHVDYGTFPATQQFAGRGGLSKFYLGSGIALLKDLSFGVNGAYIWGNYSSTESIYIPAEYNKYNIEKIRSTYVGDLYFDYGLQYHKVLKEKYRLVAGVTVNPATPLSATQDYGARSMGVGGIVSTKDTIVNDATKEGTVHLPNILKVGVSLEEADHWTFCADIRYAQWSSFSAFNLSDSLKDMTGISVGGSYIPSSTDYTNYFKRIEYRLGARYDNGYLNVSGTDIATFGISAGLGLPLGKSRSRLNITGEYMAKGTTDKNLIAEQYWRVILGITFTDRWFVRYKYD